MKITYKGDYALKALFQLALHYNEGEEGVMSINDIAGSGDMPVKFLEQILLTLRRGNFVKSRRGINGGFILARSPREITIGEVVRFMEGPIEPIACVQDEYYKGCKDTASCIFRDVWREVRDAISAVVDTVTFEDMVMKYRERELSVAPSGDYAI
ncbi:MAG: Rrf2 family transcriptional regulator [Candidatus Omnitrophica bacterium]|nr:Rrf2 family transcriptional regulator [Candidatus Omnitrophota bacterium]